MKSFTTTVAMAAVLVSVSLGQESAKNLTTLFTPSQYDKVVAQGGRVLGESRDVSNIGVFLEGVDLLHYNIWEGTGSQGQIFKATYADDIVVDGFRVPDGVTMTHTNRCTLDAKAETISGGESFVKNQENSIKVSSSYSPLPLTKASFEASTAYKTTVDKTNNHKDVFTFTTMSCQVYQLKLQQNDLPLFTRNFLNAVSYAVQKSNAEEAYAIVQEFGTSYMVKGDMGSRIERTFRSSELEYKTLRSSSVDVNVAASYTAQNYSVGTEIQSTTEQKQSNYFNSLSTQEQQKTIGTDIPSASDTTEMVALWMKNTKESDSLGLISGIEVQGLERLFEARMLDVYNSQLSETKQITEAQLKDLQIRVIAAAETYCKNIFGGKCPTGPSKDIPLPKPFSVTLKYEKEVGFRRSDGQIKFNYTAKQLVGPINPNGKLTMDIQLKEIKCRYSSSHLTYVEWTLESLETGNQHIMSVSFYSWTIPSRLTICTKAGSITEGKVSKNYPNIEVPEGEQIKHFRIYTNSEYRPRYLEAKVGGEWVGCGKGPNSHAMYPYEFQYNSGLLGFAGYTKFNKKKIDRLQPIAGRLVN